MSAVIALLLLVFVIALFIFSFELGSLTLGYVQHYVDGAPDWIQHSNPMAWFVFFLTFFLVIIALRFVFGNINRIIAFLVGLCFGVVGGAAAAIFAKKGTRGEKFEEAFDASLYVGALAATIVRIITWVVLAIYATKWFFTAVEPYSDLTDYFVPQEWHVFFMVLTVILVVVNPSREESKVISKEE